jgi:hypothetical protein
MKVDEEYAAGVASAALLRAYCKKLTSLIPSLQ